jgi:hypothetical protein
VLVPNVVLVPFTHDLIPAQLRPQLGPTRPVHHTEKQNADTNHREHNPGVSLGVAVAIRWDERYKCEEDIGGQVYDGDREVGVPWRFPALALAEVQVDEAGGDESVDPGSRVRVQVRDEVVCGSRRRRNKHNDCDEPMQEERGRRGVEWLH